MNTMRFLMMILLLCLAVGATAQTRRIAHRSHSGAKNERYRKGESSYGYYPMITVHLESGRDTVVAEWDSLANPRYQIEPIADTTPRANFRPRDTRPKEDIREMGGVTGKLIVHGPPQ